MIVSVQSIKILLRKMILLLVLLSCKLQCDDFSRGQVRSFSLSKNRSFNKELDVQITSATMLYFDWLVSILNSSPFTMVCRNTYPPSLCDNFF